MNRKAIEKDKEAAQKQMEAADASTEKTAQTPINVSATFFRNKQKKNPHMYVMFVPS